MNCLWIEQFGLELCLGVLCCVPVQWVPANSVLDQHPIQWEQKYSHLLNATDTGMRSDLMGHLGCMPTSLMSASGLTCTSKIFSKDGTAAMSQFSWKGGNGEAELKDTVICCDPRQCKLRVNMTPLHLRSDYVHVWLPSEHFLQIT